MTPIYRSLTKAEGGAFTGGENKMTSVENEFDRLD